MAESSKGYANPKHDMSNWRMSTRERREQKFCDRSKAIYLGEIRKHGKRALAALHANVNGTTVTRHMKEDPDFAEAFDQAYDEYRERRVRKLEAQAMNGFEETIFSPTGERATRKRFESNLRAMVLKAYAPELYQEKHSLDITVTTGIAVLPATLSNDEWEKQFEAKQAALPALPSAPPAFTEAELVMSERSEDSQDRGSE
jgi:hypothetical protein